ncbi:MAG: hypothetical protein JWN76_206 [Chitinophagaceae bacterium]|nr:hypothetical protein [Chitinophagaceae bacterium]
MKRVIYFLALSLSFVACKKNDSIIVDPTKYVFPIPQVNLTEDARVGAYYSVYKTADWAVTIPFTPTLGKYDALTASVMQQHLTWATAGGVDFFIFKWNGTADNAILSNFKTVAANSSVKMVIDYNTAHLGATNAAPLTGAKLNTMLAELKTLSDTYITSSTYYKIDAKPVVLLSPLNLAAAAATSIDYKKVADSVRLSMKIWGYDSYLVGELTTGWVAPLNYAETTQRAFDAIVPTTWSTTDYDRSFAFYSYSDLNWQNWKKTLEAWNIEFVPCIFPGWNNPSTPAQYVIPRNEKNYVDYCNVAKRAMGKNRLIFINSWNDFQKGNTLEPANEYNQDYLNLTKRELKKK